MGQEIEILIVEENLTQAEQLKHLLEQHDHKVSVEHDAQLALASIRRHKPQIVITAVLLPGMDGYALCHEIKTDENLKDVPVILLTSLSDTKDIIRGIECGADNFVTKPYDEQLLLSRIEYIVLNRELRAGAGTQTGLEIIFNGEKYFITPERQQIVDLLISTYETAVRKNLQLLLVETELNALNESLEQKVAKRTAELVEEVAERRAAEASLRESEQRYRLLGEGILHQVWTAQADGKLTYVNGRMLEYFGRTEEQLLEEGWQDAVHPDDLSGCLERWAESLQTCEYYEVEFRLRRADGEYRWHLGLATAEQDSDSQVISWYGANTDIHNQKLAEEALRESEALNRTILNSLPAQIAVIDKGGRIIAINEAWRNFAPVPDSSSHEGIGVGANYLDICRQSASDSDANLALAAITAVLNGSQTYQTLEYSCDTPTGMRWFFMSVTPMGGRSGGAVISHLDITERKTAEQALVESEERLRQSQKMESIGTLAGGVAHDFNNLLTVILGNTHLGLRKLQSDDPLQPHLVEVEKAGNRAAVLTRQLLAFSRRQHLERRTINLNDAITEIMKFLRHIIGEDIEVHMITAPGLSVTFADPAQIEQVIMNLAVNARDAMPQGGKLTIETSNVELDESYQRQYPYVVTGKYVQIRVSDTGTGIDAETCKHIFEPFFTTKEVDKGTGLGLSMVYGIIKQHDGHINVYSEVGHGTTFKIFLPVVESAAEKESPAIQLPLLGGTETILVAEDEEALRNLASAILEGLDYTVLLAKDGEEAVDIYKANRERIDMLLLDVVMPRMSGIEAYQRIRELGGDVPMIFMTGYSTETVQSRFVKQNELMEELGAIVLQKPYNIEGLGRKIREVLDKSEGS